MAIKQEISFILDGIEDQHKNIKVNTELYEAYQGNLACLVKSAMAASLSPATYSVAVERIAPINVLRKVVDKLSTIYQQNPVRTIDEGTEIDSELLKYYEDSFSINRVMNSANEFMVMSKASAVMPFIHRGVPRLRSLPANKFIVLSSDPIDPTFMTHFITIQGKCRDRDGNEAIKYNVWTDEEFLIINSKGEIQSDEMLALGNPDGINPFGKIPAVYINRSDDMLVPYVDSDMLQMTILIPLVLSDLNVGAMFTVWPIMWSRDVEVKDMVYSPKTLIQMFTDPTTNKTPELGTLEPKMDIPNQLSLLQSELGFWLNTKNIRAGAVGQLTVDNFSSGISKMIDEGDTVEERKRQIEIFKKAEADLWDLVINYMHRVWVQSGMMEQKQLFTPGVDVDTEFPVQLPMTTRGQVVTDLVAEVNAGFISRREAIKKLNPEFTDAQIDELILEIDTEAGQNTTVQIQQTQPDMTQPTQDNAQIQEQPGTYEQDPNPLE